MICAPDHAFTRLAARVPNPEMRKAADISAPDMHRKLSQGYLLKKEIFDKDTRCVAK